MTANDSLGDDLGTEAAFAAAVEHHRGRRLDEAEALYAAVLRDVPGHVRASHNLGALLLQRKAVDQALPLLAYAAQADPDGPQSWITYAHGLIAAEQFAQAQDLLAAHIDRAGDPSVRALEIRLRQVWAMALMDANDLAAAEMQFARVLEIAPDDAEAHADMGLLRLRMEDGVAAEAELRRALTIAPRHVGALTNLATALRLQGREGEAETMYRQALALDPGNIAAVRSLGVLLGDLGRYPEALAWLDVALTGSPNDLKARFKRAPLRLLLCEFEGGWQDWEARWQDSTFMAGSAGVVSAQLQPLLRPDITLEELAGRRVLLVGEQGIGDQVMFASMIPDLAAVAGSITCVCDRRLVGLFSNSFPGVTFFGPRDADIGMDAFDVMVAIGSLGRFFRNSLEAFPGEPFLKPRQDRVDRWTERLGARPPGLRIGLSWRGGTPETGMADRSVTVAQLAPVLALPDCQFVNLQYGDVEAEVAAANLNLPHPIQVFPPAEMTDFEDLAALVAALDVVVSVQTAVVHLSGALGKPCLALIPRKPEWRYTAKQPTMPWYGSVRLFRKLPGEDWAPAIERLTGALRDRNPSAAAR